MALLFVDSFDPYVSADLSLKWLKGIGGIPGIVNNGPARTGANCLKCTGNSTLEQLTANTQTLTVGFAWQTNGLDDNGGANHIVLFRDATTTQIALVTGLSNSLRVLSGVTELATTAPGLFPLNTWQHIGMSVTIAAAGSFTVWLNGVVIMQGTGVNTQQSANAYSNGVMLRCRQLGIAYLFDDFYLLDNTGAANNAFLGDIRIASLVANQDGTHQDWTPNSVSAHYPKVSEVPPDGDTSYVYSATPGQIDSYRFQQIAVTGRIAGVQQTVVARKDDAGSRVIQNYALSGGATQVSANESITNSYQYFISMLPTDPNTGADWTQAGVNAAEFGQVLIS